MRASPNRPTGIKLIQTAPRLLAPRDKAGSTHIQAVMKGIEINLNREDKGVGLAGLAIQTVEFGMRSRPDEGTMVVDVGLNIIVQDLNPGASTLHPQRGGDRGRKLLLQVRWETFDPDKSGERWRGYHKKLSGHMKSLKVVYPKKVMEVIHTPLARASSANSRC